MFAKLLNPIHRFFANPQLPWILLWIGLAFLIVALIVMIRTNWGQSHPLRKCAALSLLAHLLLLCYATSVHIVTASGSGHQGGVSLLLVDGAETGSDVGTDDGADQSSMTEAVDGASAAADKSTPAASVAHVPPPLLEVAAQTPSKPEPPVEPPPAKTADEPVPAVEQAKPEPVAADPEPSKAPIEQTEPPAEKIAEAPPEKPVDKPSEPLPSEAPPAPLAKLPEAPSTSEVSDWVAGDPSGASAPTPPAPVGPLNEPTVSAKPEPQEKPDTDHAATPTEQASSTPTAPSSVPASPTVTGPVAESAAAPIASYAVPQIYSDRVSPNRAEAARQRGGSPGSESAVQAALHWLALHQSSDGRWDADKFGAGQESAVMGQYRQNAGAKADTAVTGLALLAFLGAGNTHQHGDYSQNVQRGLEFLLSSQAPDGNLAGQAETFAFMYSHGMATLALSEAYAMTGDKRLQPAVQSAINYTLTAQIRSSGGWRYRAIESPGERGDTSQLGWQLMSLKSAELAGINVPPSTIDGAVRYIKSVSSGQYGGRASYRPGERPTRPMTAEALVCRQFLGMARDNPAGDEAGEYLMSDLPSPDRINLYYWYYATLGMYQLQGESWQRWNQALQTTLISRQRTDGDLAGSWDPECIWGGYGGRIYSTALSTLCLEVYYRYLPLYQTAGRTAAPPAVQR